MNYWPIDADIAPLGYGQTVVQFGHHSYNPTKECTPDPSPQVQRTCQPNTWHWDNVSVNPAAPFTIVRADRRLVDADRPGPFVLDRPAPANASVRFAAVGTAVELSYDGGATWRPALKQAHSRDTGDETFASYWTPIPAGTTRVAVRGQRWWGGPFAAKDLSVWAQAAPGGTPSTPTTVPTATRTTIPTATLIPATPTALASSTPIPTSIPAPSPTTAAPASTATPTNIPATPTETATATPTLVPPPSPLDVPCSLTERVLTCVLPT